MKDNTITQQVSNFKEEELMTKTMTTHQDALLSTAKQLLLEYMNEYEKKFDSDENQPVDDMIRYCHTFDFVTRHIGHEPTPWQCRVWTLTQAYCEHSEFI